MSLVQLHTTNSNSSLSIGTWDIPSMDHVVALSDPVKQPMVVNDDLDCPKCHVEMTKSWNEYNMVCPKCSMCYPVEQTGEHHTIGAGENHNTPVQGSRNLHPRFLGNFALIHQKICALCHPIHEDATGKFDAFTPAGMPDKGGGLHTRESIENTRE